MGWRGYTTAAGTAAILISAVAWAAPSVDPLVAERARLVAAKKAAGVAENRAARLDAEAAAEKGAAAKAAVEQRAITARIDKAKADIAAAQSRIALVEGEMAMQRTALAAEQGPVVRLIAALSAFARRPPIAAVAQPGSIDDMVHVRAVLGTVTPVIAQRTAGLRETLDHSRALSASAALAFASRSEARAALDNEQLALSRLEINHRQRSRSLGRAALAASDRALALGEAAEDAAARINTIGGARETVAALARLADPTPRPAPATRFALARSADDAPYQLPVTGRLVIGLGEVSSAGVRSRGLTFATEPQATVVAPAGGRIAYAKPFGDFGVVVIIDHGDGWTSLLTGLGDASVAPGAIVVQGAPIGKAGRDGRVGIELRRRSRPVDMIPLLG